MLKPVTIVGGGLAGLTLGIGLRQCGVPVSILEAGTYPRHRVCGEFINGKGIASLESLGLLEGLREAGAVQANTAAFFSGQLAVPARLLPSPALCVSRFYLDAWLVEKFRGLGGELQTDIRWTGEYKEGVVRASGRRAVGVSSGWRLFGLKVHATGVNLAADLEMHFLPAGYVGLCRLPNNEVNVCGLFRSRTAEPGLSEHWRQWLNGPEGSVLHSRIAGAEIQAGSFCSVAGISLRSARALELQECCVGDALTMIPPLTGNGMSMAFESAELAIKPLVGYSQNHLSWESAQRLIAAGCDGQFASRLRWSGWIQRVLFQSTARRILFAVAARSEGLWRVIVERTR